jgi:hypothetical protein
MKKSKFTEQQIVFALKQSETGVPVAEVCRKTGTNFCKDEFFLSFRVINPLE